MVSTVALPPEDISRMCSVKSDTPPSLFLSLKTSFSRIKLLLEPAVHVTRFLPPAQSVGVK